MTIGGNLQASAGPIGRLAFLVERKGEANTRFSGTGGSINVALQNPAPMFSYSKSRGLFAGVSLEGTGLFERVETNVRHMHTLHCCPVLLFVSSDCILRYQDSSGRPACVSAEY